MWIEKKGQIFCGLKMMMIVACGSRIYFSGNLGLIPMAVVSIGFL